MAAGTRKWAMSATPSMADSAAHCNVVLQAGMEGGGVLKIPNRPAEDDQLSPNPWLKGSHYAVIADTCCTRNSVTPHKPSHKQLTLRLTPALVIPKPFRRVGPTSNKYFWDSHPQVDCHESGKVDDSGGERLLIPCSSTSITMAIPCAKPETQRSLR
eukprot:5270725-Amphidinium_carterae.1